MTNSLITMYDLAIIGGGPGGYIAAQRAASAGLSTVLFERKELGGVCLCEGCIPTKTLLHSAKVYNYALGGEAYGVSAAGVSTNYSRMVDRKEKVVRKLSGGVRAALRACGAEVVKAEAFIKGRGAEGIEIEADGRQFYARNLLICTGSEAVIPPIPGIKEAGQAVVTSREILSLREQPRELVIIGGGVIGMEFAALYSALGTKVTVVEMLPKILGPIDGEVSALLQDIYSRRGVDFHLGCKVTGIEGNAAIFESPEGDERRIAADRILVCIGRRANFHGLGLENLGVEFATDRNGRAFGIKVDAQMRTNVPGIYAAGDVTGFSMLAHTASREGEVAVNSILGKTDTMRYNAIPGVVYTNPEVACVGLSEKDAREKGIDCAVLKLPMAFSGRFVAENERGEGFCKLVVDKNSHEVLGAHMIGGPCSEIISGICIAIEQKMTAEQLKEVVFPHPTVSEIIKETAFTLD